MTIPTSITSISYKNAIKVPLLACVEAQKQANSNMLDYLQDGLLQKDSQGRLCPIYISFQYSANGQIMLLRIPMLSIVPIPYLQISNIDFTYQMCVTAFTKDTFKLKYKNGQEEVSNSETLDSNLNIHLHAGTADMPLGLAKLYEMLSNNFTSIEEIP